jgi:hypothetical protein
MKKDSITITEVLNQAFKKHPRHLQELRRALGDKENTETVKDLAAKYIEPIIADISSNFGQEMDPFYVGYMVQYSLGNPNHEFSSAPKGVGAYELSVDDLTKADTLEEFIRLNLPKIMPMLVKASEAAGLTFDKNFKAQDTEGAVIPCPDLCGDENGTPILDRVDDWICRVLDTVRDMYLATGGQIEINEKIAEAEAETQTNPAE